MDCRPLAFMTAVARLSYRSMIRFSLDVYHVDGVCVGYSRSPALDRPVSQAGHPTIRGAEYSCHISTFDGLSWISRSGLCSSHIAQLPRLTSKAPQSEYLIPVVSGIGTRPAWISILIRLRSRPAVRSAICVCLDP